MLKLTKINDLTCWTGKRMNECKNTCMNELMYDQGDV